MSKTSREQHSIEGREVHRPEQESFIASRIWKHIRAASIVTCTILAIAASALIVSNSSYGHSSLPMVSKSHFTEAERSNDADVGDEHFGTELDRINQIPVYLPPWSKSGRSGKRSRGIEPNNGRLANILQKRMGERGNDFTYYGDAADDDKESDTSGAMYGHTLLQSVIEDAEPKFANSRNFPLDILLSQVLAAHKSRLFKEITTVLGVASSDVFQHLQRRNPLLAENGITTDSPKEGKSSISLRRHLSAEAWNAFNDLFHGTVIALPGVENLQANLPWPLTALSVDIRNLRCTNLAVTDIQLSHGRRANSSTNYDISVSISGVSVDCTMDWWYTYEGGKIIGDSIKGNGSATINVANSSLFLSMTFISKNLDYAAPTKSAVYGCNANILISNLNFVGGISGTIIDVFKQLVTKTIEDQVSKTACTELDNLNSVIDDMLKKMQSVVSGYTNAYPNNADESVVPETVASQLQKSKDEVLDFQKGNGTTLRTIFGWTDDIVGKRADGSVGINDLIKSNMLDPKDGSFTIDMSELPLSGSGSTAGVLYQGGDMLTETIISITSLKLYGLDTFTEFDALNVVAGQLLHNEIQLSKLDVDIGLRIDLRPSDKADSVIVQGSVRHLVENIVVRMSASNISASVSLLAAIDANKLGSMELGSLLLRQTAFQAMGCIFDTFALPMEFTYLSATVGTITSPNVTGFIDGGVDNVLSSASSAAFDMLEPELLLAVPGFFQTTAKGILNNLILHTLFDESASSPFACPEIQLPDTSGKNDTIDFRDLLLIPSTSKARGGSGTAPYGSAISKVLSIANNDLFEIDLTTGLPKINEAVIQPFTTSESGVRGTYKFHSILVDFTPNSTSLKFLPAPLLSAVGDFAFRTVDVRVSNLDTVESIVLLRPSSVQADVVQNNVNIGTLAKPVTGQASLQIDYGTNKNTLNVSLGVSGVEIDADILAMISSSSFLHFPLRNAMNLQCWLTIFQWINNQSSPALGIEDFHSQVLGIDLNVDCISCQAGMKELPVIIDMLENEQFFSAMGFVAVNQTTSFFNGNALQGEVNRMLDKAGELCSSSDSKATPSIALDTKKLLLLAMPHLIEMVIVGSTIALETVCVVTSADLYSVTASVSDPLLPQRNMQVPTGVNLFDFEKLSKESRWFKRARGLIGTRLGGVVDDPNSPTGKNLAVNVLIRDSLADEDGGVTVSIPKVANEYEEPVSIRIRIFGLDTFTTFDLLNPIGPQTFQNTVGLKSFGVELQLTVSTPLLSNGRRASQSSDSHNITVRTGLKGLNATLSFLLAADKVQLGDTKLRSVLNVTDGIVALLSAVTEFNVSQLDVNVDEIDKPEVEGLLSQDLSDALLRATSSIFDKYGSSLLQSLPKFFSNTVRGLLNSIFLSFRHGSNNGTISLLPPFGDDFNGKFVDFRDLLLAPKLAAAYGGSGDSPYGDLFVLLKQLVNSQLLSSNSQTGMSNINGAIIDPLTQSQSNITGSIIFGGNLYYQESKFSIPGLSGQIEIGASNASVDNLDSVGSPLVLLQPDELLPHLLDNRAMVGVSSKPIKAMAHLLFALEGDNMNMRNDINFYAEISTARIFASILALIDEERFFNFPLRDVMNPYCWLATIPAPSLSALGVPAGETSTLTAALHNLTMSVDELKLGLHCFSCSSPGFVKISQELPSSDSIAEATNLANKLLLSLVHLLRGEFVQVKIDRLLNEADKRCPHSPDYQKNFTGFSYSAFPVPKYTDSSSGMMVALVIFFAVAAFAAACVVAFTKWMKRRKHFQWLKHISYEDKQQLYKQQIYEEKVEKTLDASPKSLFRSDRIPWAWRWLMPIIVLANIALFLSGHLSLGATVTVFFTVAGQKLTIDKFFEFSMAKSVGDIWKAGAKELALIILVFSGIWPYTKQLTTLLLWFSPPSLISTSRRGTICLWLETLAKWSMVDIYFLLVTMVAFWISIKSPDEQVDFLKDLYSVDLMVIPLWGLYANLLAQLVSQVIAHFLVYYHERTVHHELRAISERERTSEFDDYDRKCDLSFSEGEESIRLHGETNSAIGRSSVIRCSALRYYIYRIESKRGGDRHVIVPKYASATLGCLGVLAIIVLIAGCVVPSFRIEVLGLVGVAIEVGQGGRTAIYNYSVVGIARVVMDQARYLKIPPQFVGLGCLASLMVLTSLVVPVVQVMVMLYIWFAKEMSLKIRKRLVLAIEVLQAWQYVEVFLLSIIIGTWQLGKVSGFMINDVVNGALDDMLGSLVFYGLLPPDDAQPFYTQASLRPGAYLLLCAAFLLLCLTQFIMRAEKQQRISLNGNNLYSVHELKDVLNDVCDVDELSTRIKPIPLRFTDMFRWLLVPIHDRCLPPEANATFSEDEDGGGMPHGPIPAECAVRA